MPHYASTLNLSKTRHDAAPLQPYMGCIGVHQSRCIFERLAVIREILIQWRHNDLLYVVRTDAEEWFEFVSIKSLMAWIDSKHLQLACEVS
jgi:hypothetical protein